MVGSFDGVLLDSARGARDFKNTSKDFVLAAKVSLKHGPMMVS